MRTATFPLARTPSALAYLGPDVNVDRRLTVEHRAHGYRVWLAIGAGSRDAADPRFVYELLDCLGKRFH